MDLGIAGRKAIICASSRGLGKACAMSLARNGVDVTINGRDASVLEKTAAEIRAAAPTVEVSMVVGNVSDPQCQAALLSAVPEVDILVNNNGGPPFRDFRELDRDAMIEGVTMNMITPIELITGVVDGMAGRKFGRIVNITSIWKCQSSSRMSSDLPGTKTPALLIRMSMRPCSSAICLVRAVHDAPLVTSS